MLNIWNYENNDASEKTFIIPIVTLSKAIRNCRSHSLWCVENLTDKYPVSSIKALLVYSLAIIKKFAYV